MAEVGLRCRGEFAPPLMSEPLPRVRQGKLRVCAASECSRAVGLGSAQSVPWEAGSDASDIERLLHAKHHSAIQAGAGFFPPFEAGPGAIAFPSGCFLLKRPALSWAPLTERSVS